MKLRSFLAVLGIVALVAIIYSPSTIGIAPGSAFGTTSPTDTTANGASQFLTYLRQTGYHVVLMNDSRTEQALLANDSGVLLLIGLDTPLSPSEQQSVVNSYVSGRVSLLVAEGNTTNQQLINTLYDSSVTGAAISDPLSGFKDARVFTVTVSLGLARVPGLLDIASPIQLGQSGQSPIATLAPAAATSPLSTDAFNGTVGARVVIATSVPLGPVKSLLLTDSAPFTNYLFGYNQTVNEKAFVGKMVDWVAGSNQGVTILYDNFHYQSTPPKFGVNLHLGPLVAYILGQDFANLDKYYSAFPGQVQGFLQGVGVPISENLARVFVSLIVLLTVYGAVARWFAPEQRGKDDQPVPNIEAAIVAESPSRIDFLTTSRSKSFYVATLARLHEVLDDIVRKEFGAGASAVTLGQLEARLGKEKGQEAFRLFADLAKVYDYARGERRFLLPPVISWKSRASHLTARAEQVLNQLGMTMTGSGETNQPIEYSLRGH